MNRPPHTTTKHMINKVRSLIDVVHFVSMANRARSPLTEQQRKEKQNECQTKKEREGDWQENAKSVNQINLIIEFVYKLNGHTDYLLEFY